MGSRLFGLFAGLMGFCSCSTPADPFAPPPGFRASDRSAVDGNAADGNTAAAPPAAGQSTATRTGTTPGTVGEREPSGTPAQSTRSDKVEANEAGEAGDAGGLDAAGDRGPSEPAEGNREPARLPPIVPGTDLLTTLERQLKSLRARSGPRGLESLRRGVDRPTRLRFGFARLLIGRLADADQVFGALLERDPDDAVAGVGAARSALLGGDLTESRRLFERALRSPQATRSVAQAASLGLAQVDLYASSAADIERGRRRLRELLATGPAVEAALLLADSLADDEQLVEARSVLEAGLVRAPGDAELRFALARIEADSGALELAAKTLRELRQEVNWVHVAVELAMVERSLGRLSASRAIYEEVLARADEPEVRKNRKGLERELQILLEEEKAGRRLYRTPRESLSILRNGASAAARRQAFEQLARRTRSRSNLRRYLRIARSDQDPSVRISALRVGASVTDELAPWIRDGLADSDAEVRAAAAALATPLPLEQGGPMLLAALDKETDGYAFRELFEVLNEVTGQSRFLPSGAEDDADQRAAAVAQWSDWRTKWAK